MKTRIKITGKSNNLRVFIILLITVLYSITANGQQYKISIFDAKFKEPVPFAHVCFEEPNSDFKSYVVSDQNGVVSMPDIQHAIIAISFVGYNTYIDTIEVNKDYKFYLSPNVFDLDQVVVTASFVPQKVDQSIYNVKVIDRRDIEIKAATNLSEIMANEVNVKLEHDAALGTSMRLKGLSGNNVKILVDGVPVIGRMGGNIDLSQLNLYNIDHIEIVEGPLSVIYGSNALAGAINIITKENTYSTVNSSINAYYESIGTYNFDGWLSQKKGKHSYSLSGGRNFFTGYSLQDTSRWKEWKPKEQYNGDLKYQYNSDKTKIKYQSSLMRERLWSQGALRPPLYFEAMDNWFYTFRLSNRLEYTRQLKKDYILNMLGSHSFYQRRDETFIKDLSTLDETLTDQDTTKFNAYTYRILLGNQNPDKRFSFVSGIDLNYEIGTGERIHDNKKEVGDYAIFTSLMYKLNHTLMVQPGLRLAYNTKFNVPLVPSINVKWHALPVLDIRASYTRGYRAPSLKELYIYFVDINHNIQPNENLKAEYGNNFDLSFSFNTERKEKTHYTNVDLSLFYNNMHNIIYLARRLENSSNDFIYQYINILNYNTLGGQVSFHYNYYPYLDFNLGFGETGTLASFDEGNLTFGDYFFTPDLKLNTSIYIPKTKLRFSFYYKYTGKNKLYDIDENDDINQSILGDYHTLDFTVLKKLFSNRISLSVGAKNILNNTSIDISGRGSGGVHTSGDSSPVGYGRVYFTRLTFNLYK